MYESGRGVPADDHKAAEYLQAAADRGHLLARRDITLRLLRREHNLWRKSIWILALVRIFFDGLRIAWKNPDDKRLGKH